MNNLSLHLEDIMLNPGGIYYVLDALYLGDIKSAGGMASHGDMNAYMREKIFPYVRTPFAIIDTRWRSDALVVHVDDIRSASDQLAEANIESCFVTDTGVIIFLRQENMSDLISVFDFNDLVDTNGKQGDVNVDYWNRISTRYPHNDIALMLAPGLESGYDFVGSGLYIIKS